jgi:hypothetical protein
MRRQATPFCQGDGFIEKAYNANPANVDNITNRSMSTNARRTRKGHGADKSVVEKDPNNKVFR